MTKVPFTNEGIEQKRQELYALPDQDFRHQLELMQSEPKNWAIDNFDFSQEQVSLINEFPDEVFEQFGLQFAIAFDYQLDIIIESQAQARGICKGAKGHVKGEAGWTQGNPVYIKKIEVGVSIPLW